MFVVKLLKEILREQIKTKEALKDIALNHANYTHNKEVTSPLAQQSIFGGFQLPINKDQDLRSFDEFVKDENNFEKSVNIMVIHIK